MAASARADCVLRDRQASSEIAQRYTAAIVDRCEALSEFPHRGTPRDDLRGGVRTMPFRRRVTIAYAVEGEQVWILGIFYGGQDFEGILTESE